MTRSVLRRTVASFLFLLLVSLTALAAAAPLRSVTGPKARPAKNQPVVTSLWNTLVHIWEKAGGSLDPDPCASAEPSLHFPHPSAKVKYALAATAKRTHSSIG